MSNPSFVTAKSLSQLPSYEAARGVVNQTPNHQMDHQQDIDVTKRDRFELLSAYVDGELPPEERRMVLD